MKIEQLHQVDVFNVDLGVEIELRYNIHKGRTLYVHVDGVTVCRIRVSPQKTLVTGKRKQDNIIITLIDETKSIKILDPNS